MQSESQASTREGRLPAVQLWLLVAAALHGLVFQVLLPPWMGEDEPWHLEYARALAHSTEETRSILPSRSQLADASPSQRRVQERTGAALVDVISTQEEILESMRTEHFWRRVDFAGWEHGAKNLDRFTLGHSEAHQPELYYRVCALVLSATGVESVAAQLFVLRCLSYLFYLLVVGITFVLAKQLSKDPWLPILAALLIAWLPMHARQSAVVSNDVLVKVFTAVVLWLLSAQLVRPLRAPAALVIPLCVVLAMATKQTAVGLAGPLVLLLLSSSIRRRGALLGTLQGAAAIAISGVAIGYWQWSSTTARDALDGLGFPRNAAELKDHLAWIASPNFWREFADTISGSFNWYSRDLPPVMVVFLLSFLGLGLLGSVVVVRRKPEAACRPVVILCWLALATQILAMMARGFPAGRFLFPVLPAVMTLVATGWLSLLSPERKRGAVLLIVTGLVVFDGFALWNGLFKHHYLIWGS